MKKELLFLGVELAIYFAIYEIYRGQREILEKLDKVEMEVVTDNNTVPIKPSKVDTEFIPRAESSRSD